MIASAAVLLVGCASTNNNSLQQAAAECGSVGFRPGTELYLNCIQGRSQQLNQPSFVQQYVLNKAAAPRYYYPANTNSTQTTCIGSGNMVQCNSY